MVLSILQILAKPIFGTFNQEEFKKFLRLGFAFSCIIGCYWTLRTLKYAIFCPLVGASEIPYAKTVSLICLIPLVMFYSTLLDKLNRRTMFYTLASAYAVMIIIFALLLSSESIGEASYQLVAARTGFASLGTKILGYAWYFFVESYGSLLVALFWAIASDTTKPQSAKQGFYLVTALGQVGGILGPVSIARLPRYFGLATNGLAIAACSLITLLAIFAVKNFFTQTPKELLTSYHATPDKDAKEKPGLAEGLKLLVSKKYLLGIFAAIAFFEIIVTIFDLHFQILASATYSGTDLTEYLGWYGSSVNLVTLISLLLGISNITKYFGLRVSLVLMPIITACAITGFITFDSLTFLFILMVGSKALNYGLNGPAIKQLYIPTSHDVRFKAQAWIETFGSRGAKEAGSIFNMSLKPLQAHFGLIAGRLHHIALSSYLGYSLVIAWFFIALFLGKTYKKAIDNNEIVC